MMEHNLIPRLPAPAEEIPSRNVPAPSEYYRASSGPPDTEASAMTSVPLSHYLWILRRHCWKILAFITAVVSATVLISLRLVPIYESTATVDIDRQMPSAIIGQEATRTMANDSDQFLATQSKLMQSDSVLRPVARKYKLQEAEADEPTAAQTAAAQDAPVLLKNLKITRPPNTYLLLISYRSANARLAADVANAIATSYLDHTYNIRFKSSASLSAFMERQLEELKAKMERSGSALAQFERELNVISPEQKTSILSARLLQLNTEYTNAQADRVRKESAFKSVAGGSLEAAQVSTQGDALKRLSERLDEQTQRFAEVKAHYGPTHPEFRKAALQVAEIERQLQSGKANIGQRVEVEFREALDREAMLHSTVAETKAEFDGLNAHSFEYQSLKREAEADKTLYEELVRKIKEASINSGFQTNAIRIADLARPALKAVFPNIKLNTLLAFLFSTLLAIGTAIVADLLNNAVRDPEHISRMLSTDVIGTLPAVKEWHGRLTAAPAETSSALVPGDFSRGMGLSAFQEAIRTLRNSILLTDFDRRIRSLMVTSSNPSEGKSTTAAHLALAHAQQGRRTLLIDGDLRRPSIHRRFDLPGLKGLTTVLTSGVPWRSVVVNQKGLPTLDILPAGPPSRRAADLVGVELAALLEDASSEYDLVILDSPPLLGFPEPLQMAASVDGVLAVALAGRTNRKALSSTVNTLKRLRANIVGIVLNEVRANSSDSYYYHSPKYYRHYQNVDVESES